MLREFLFYTIILVKLSTAEKCLLKSSLITVPLVHSNASEPNANCIMKRACATFSDNNVISIATSFYDIQYENQWNNYSDTMLAKCAWSCRSVDQCVGFNFRKSKTINRDDVFCHLFLTEPILYLPNDDCVYYQEAKDNDTVICQSKTSLSSQDITAILKHLRTLDNLSEFRNLNACQDENDQFNRIVLCPDVKFLSTSKITERCETYLGNSDWTTIQRRMDGSENFNRGWKDYQAGFGIRRREFWIGNDKLYEMTSKNKFKLLVVLEDFEDNVRCALYDTFSVGPPSSNYTLTVGGYSGDAGDSLSVHNNTQFSTCDADHDTWYDSCAAAYKGGWWFIQCHSCHLNGLYLRGLHVSNADGVNWAAFLGRHYSLKFTEMKIAVA